MIILIDEKKLKEKLKEYGTTMSILSEKVGISRYSLYNKIKNKTEFKASEIARISNFLKLTNEDVNSIFFN